MRSNRLPWLFVSTFVGLALVSPTAFAEPVGSSPTAPDRQNPAQISTSRSDGAIFPAVIQTQRVQKRRQVRVSASGQALSNRKLASPQEESAQGGVFVAAAAGTPRAREAGEAGEGEDGAHLSQTIIPYVAVDARAKRRAKR